MPDLKWTIDGKWYPKLGTAPPKLQAELCDLLDDFTLAQLVTEPKRGENVLDLVWTTNPNRVDGYELEPPISDHAVIGTSVTLPSQFVREKIIISPVA